MAVRVLGAVALALFGSLTLSCTGIVDPSKNQVKTFTGTIRVQKSDSQAFSTSRNGEYSIKVTSLDPPTTTFFGVILALGTSGGGCTTQIIANNSFATVNTLALNSSILPGNYCVYLYDAGFFTTDETYTVQVSYP